MYPVGLLALYNSLGREVEDVQGLADGAVYYLVRRDNFFFWPGVRLGHKTVLGAPGWSRRGSFLSLPVVPDPPA